MFVHTYQPIWFSKENILFDYFFDYLFIYIFIYVAKIIKKIISYYDFCGLASKWSGLSLSWKKTKHSLKFYLKFENVLWSQVLKFNYFASYFWLLILVLQLYKISSKSGDSTYSDRDWIIHLHKRPVLSCGPINNITLDLFENINMKKGHAECCDSKNVQLTF